MYVADPRIRYIPANREQVVSIITSLNKPHIAVPGKAAQEVQAFVVTVRDSAGHRTIFVYLFLSETREAVIYVDPRSVRLDAAVHATAEAEAVAFLESMGFMLETLNYLSLAPDQQAQLLQSLPCFTPGSKSAGSEAKLAERAESPQTRLARLFAAF